MSGTNNVKKVSELPITNNAASDDRILILKTPGGSPSTRTITVSNLFNNSAANVTIKEVSPPGSNISVTQGTIFYDTNYLYIAVANNTLKRITLESF